MRCWRAILVSGMCAVDRAHSTSFAMIAFWACRRFSASSQTTLRGPSITSVVISLPR